MLERTVCLLDPFILGSSARFGRVHAPRNAVDRARFQGQLLLMHLAFVQYLFLHLFVGVLFLFLFVYS